MSAEHNRAWTLGLAGLRACRRSAKPPSPPPKIRGKSLSSVTFLNRVTPPATEPVFRRPHDAPVFTATMPCFQSPSQKTLSEKNGSLTVDVENENRASGGCTGSALIRLEVRPMPWEGCGKGLCFSPDHGSLLIESKTHPTGSRQAYPIGRVVAGPPPYV